MKSRRSFMSRSRTQTGFTLIEIMLVVLIIGLLSSIGLPVMREFTYHAKQAERSMVMSNLMTAVNDFGDKFPTDLGGGTSEIFADWNPPLPFSAVKKTYVPTVTGWSALSWQPDGSLYFNYYIFGFQMPGMGEYWICAQADLDANGTPSSCCRYFTRTTGDLWLPLFSEDQCTPTANEY